MVKQINRRHFLVSSAGALVSIPFLESIAQGATPPTKLRLITLRAEQGGYQEDFWPEMTTGGTPLSDGKGTTYNLATKTGAVSQVFGTSYDTLKKKMLLVRGLHPLTDYRGHNRSTMLGCFAQQDTLIDPPWPTIDQIISQKVMEGRETFNCALSPFYPSQRNDIHSFSLAGTKIVQGSGHWDPDLNFKRFFANFKADPATRNASFDRRAMVVDQVLQSFNALKAKRSLSSVDQTAVSQHMEHLFEIQKGIERLKNSTCAVPAISTNQDWKSSDLYQNLLRNRSVIPNIFKLNFQIAVAALQCDLVRTVNFAMFQDAATSTNVAGAHGLHHMNGTVESHGLVLTLDRWYAEQVAVLLNLLDGVGDGSTGQSLLDNSLVMYGREMSYCESLHYNANAPIALFGGLGGRINRGQYINYSFNSAKGSGRSYNQLLISIMKAFGLQPGDWERGGQTGYGDYKLKLQNLKFHDPKTMAIVSQTIDDNTHVIDKTNALPGFLVGA